VRQILALIWATRPCFACDSFGACQHREIAADLGVYFAEQRRLDALGVPRDDAQMVLPGFAPAGVEDTRVH
jgi:hypothetical protein